MSSHHKRKHWSGKNERRKEKTTEEDVNVDESSPVIQMFRSFQQELDQKHDKYERIVKLSRDVTIESKRAIFLLHRVNGNQDGDADVFKQTEEKLNVIETTKFKEMAKELVGVDPFKFLRAYTAGLQEYIEALTFYHYLKDKNLVGLGAVQERLTFTVDIIENTADTPPADTPSTDTPPTDTPPTDTPPTDQPMGEELIDSDQVEETSTPCNVKVAKQTLHVPIPFEEYILGVADLTGEMMRRAINSVGAGNLEEPFIICNVLQEMEMAFACLGKTNKEVGRKLHTLRQSLRKVEAACYTLKVRGSEIPKHMLVDVLSKASASSFMDDACIVDGDDD